VLSNNYGMLKLMEKLNFIMELDKSDRTLTLVSRNL